MDNVTVIFKVLGAPEISLHLAAQECLQLFGAGANPDFKIQEEAFALCNTPVQNGYTRIVATLAFAQAMEYIVSVGHVSPYMELVMVEWQGQTEFVTAEYDDPESGHVQELLGYMAELPIAGD